MWVKKEGSNRGKEGRKDIVIAENIFNGAFERQEASVVMQRLSYPTETVSSNKITRNRIVLSLKDSLRKPL